MRGGGVVVTDTGRSGIEVGRAKPYNLGNPDTEKASAGRAASFHLDLGNKSCLRGSLAYGSDLALRDGEGLRHWACSGAGRTYRRSTSCAVSLA